MAFEKLAEARIREAMKAGEFSFDGPGQPIDLDGYFALPEDIRMGYSILRSANCLPEELQLMKDVAAAKDRLARETGSDQVALARRALRDAEMKLAITREERLTRARSRP
jgi:hypothetical protein